MSCCRATCCCQCARFHKPGGQCQVLSVEVPNAMLAHFACEFKRDDALCTIAARGFGTRSCAHYVKSAKTRETEAAEGAA